MKSQFLFPIVASIALGFPGALAQNNGATVQQASPSQETAQRFQQMSTMMREAESAHGPRLTELMKKHMQLMQEQMRDMPSSEGRQMMGKMANGMRGGRPNDGNGMSPSASDMANQTQMRMDAMQGMMKQMLDQQELIMQSILPNAHAQSEASEDHHPAVAGQKYASANIPKPLQVEHEELHSELARLTKAGGRTGEAAQKLAEVLDPHFQKENAYALPPLGLLVPLSTGKFDCGMTAVLNLTDKLQAEMPAMLSEHKDIGTALARLRNAAELEHNAGGVQFADHLAAHAQMEEHVTYPTALLIGLYVKSRSDQCPQ
jgi:hypothetical protein